MNRTDYRNQFTKNHYDRISLTVPKGYKGKIKKCADQNGVSVNEYIFRLLNRDMDENGSSRLASASRFGESEKRILQKWQVATKYYDMIESISDQDGYYVQLKPGFINDVTGCRTLQADSMRDIRIMITKSHPVRTGLLIEGLDEETVDQLKRWQIPLKYYPMIESVSASKVDGFTITLKEGFINDFSGSRIIHVDKTNLFKRVMKYSH